MFDPRGAFLGVVLAAGAGCDAPASSGGTVSAPPAPSLAPSAATSAAPAPSGASSGPVVPAIPCRTATDCGANGWCQFDRPGCGPAIRGVCAGPQASCTVYYPFCSCTGETVGACEKPLVPYVHPGSCADAGVARPSK